MCTIVLIKYITRAQLVSNISRLKLMNFIGALIVYDITDTDSFEKMTFWVKELR